MPKFTKYSKLRPKRRIKGMFKCNLSNCKACPFIKESKVVKKGSKNTWQLNQKFTCHSANVIYLIECKKERCKQRYIGHTKRKLKIRLAEHRGYVINNHKKRVTGAHFNTPGHSLSDLSIIALEHIELSEIDLLVERERFFIDKFNTIREGLNQQL